MENDIEIMDVRVVILVLSLLMVIIPRLSCEATVLSRPYWSVIAQGSITSLGNDAYNSTDVFGNSSREWGYGIGVGAGVRKEIGEFKAGKLQVNGLYLGLEGFVNLDQLLKLSAAQFYGVSAGERETETVKLYSIFNARVNLGYSFHGITTGASLGEFTRPLSIFTSVGMRHFEYESTYTYTDYSQYYADEFIRYNDWKIVPSIGLGFTYSISKNLELMAGYEYSSFKIQDRSFADPNGEGTVKLTIKTMRLGLNYAF